MGNMWILSANLNDMIYDGKTKILGVKYIYNYIMKSSEKSLQQFNQVHKLIEEIWHFSWP